MDTPPPADIKVEAPFIENNMVVAMCSDPGCRRHLGPGGLKPHAALSSTAPQFICLVCEFCNGSGHGMVFGVRAKGVPPNSRTLLAPAFWTNGCNWLFSSLVRSVSRSSHLLMNPLRRKSKTKGPKWAKGAKGLKWAKGAKGPKGAKRA